jgi:hypothetical protein
MPKPSKKFMALAAARQIRTTFSFLKDNPLSFLKSIAAFLYNSPAACSTVISHSIVPFTTVSPFQTFRSCHDSVFANLIKIIIITGESNQELFLIFSEKILFFYKRLIRFFHKIFRPGLLHRQTVTMRYMM